MRGCAILVTLLLAGISHAQNAAKPKLLIAFATYKDRPRHPQIHFYEHDGEVAGKIVGSIDTVTNRSDNRPSLSLDGRVCVFASELENQTSRIFVWDMKEKKLVTLPILNDSPNTQQHPWISGKGDVLAFAAWDRAGASNRWDVLLYDLAAKKLLDKPAFNSFAADERMPCFSGDGRHLAYTSNVKGGAGLTDIHLFDRDAAKAVPLGDMNSAGMDINPSLSADGRYLAFVSERIKGEGERDVFLYDRQTQKLLPTPGLNSKREDIDPFVLVLP